MATAFDRPFIENAAKCFTVEDLLALPTDLPSGSVDYEIDNGRLVTMVPPGDVHGSVQGNIVTELKVQGERKGYGKARSEVGFILWRDPDRVVGADAVFIATSSLPIKRSPDGYLETKPDLVVEIRSKNDSVAYLNRKAEDYLAAGVKVVWIVDPETRTVSVQRQGGKPTAYQSGDMLECEFIEGFALSVDGIFQV